MLPPFKWSNNNKVALSYTSFMTCEFWSVKHPPRDTQLPPETWFETWFITTIYTYVLKEGVYHWGGGGDNRFRKSWNPYIFFQRNALMDIKISIVDICYANTAPIYKTLMLYLIREWKNNKIAKVEKLTKKLMIGVRLIVIGPFRLLTPSLTQS